MFQKIYMRCKLFVLTILNKATLLNIFSMQNVLSVSPSTENKKFVGKLKNRNSDIFKLHNYLSTSSDGKSHPDVNLR